MIPFFPDPNVLLPPQVDEIAAMTMGFTGADLANLVNEVSATEGRETRLNRAGEMRLGA